MLISLFKNKKNFKKGKIIFIIDKQKLFHFPKKKFFLTYCIRFFSKNIIFAFFVISGV
jgi:hypothetical protein